MQNHLMIHIYAPPTPATRRAVVGSGIDPTTGDTILFHLDRVDGAMLTTLFDQWELTEPIVIYLPPDRIVERIDPAAELAGLIDDDSIDE